MLKSVLGQSFSFFEVSAPKSGHNFCFFVCSQRVLISKYAHNTLNLQAMVLTSAQKQAAYTLRLEISSRKTKGGRELTEEEIAERQQKLDEYMKTRQRQRSVVVHVVKKHVTAEATRVIKAVQEDGDRTRADFQDVLQGKLPSAGSLDPREELRAIKASKVLMRNREESLRALVKADDGAKPAKRQKKGSPEAVLEVSTLQLKMAEAFVKQHEKERLHLHPGKYIGGYIRQTPEEHGMKALQKSLKDYWAFVADLKLRCNDAFLLQQHLAKEWADFLAKVDQNMVSKSPSAVVAEFVSKARGLVACKEEVS